MISSALIAAILLQAPTLSCFVSDRPVGDGPPAVFEAIADNAVAIVEATVQSKVHDTQGPAQRSRLLFRVTRVLKGSDPIGEFASSPMVAAGLFNMAPGERFILFLNRNPSELGFPGRPEVPAYNIAGGAGAALCIDAGTVRTNGSAGTFRPKFEGAELEKVVADIRTYVGLRRVNGRMVLDSGPIPNGGLLFNVPYATLDPRYRPGIVLTPTEARPGARTTVAALTPGMPLGTRIPESDFQETRIVINVGGAFALPVDDGAYRVTMNGLPFGYDVQSVMYGSRDLLREPIRFDGPASQEILITLIQKSAGYKVSGRMKAPPPGLLFFRTPWAILTSDGGETRAGGVPISADGSYEFQNVPPGNYTLKGAVGGFLVPALGEPVTVSVVVSNGDVLIETSLFTGLK